MIEPWKSFNQEELERQYNARASVADFDFEIERYRSLSAQSYTECKVIQDLSYGPTTNERIDYFPSVPNAPVFICFGSVVWLDLGSIGVSRNTGEVTKTRLHHTQGILCEGGKDFFETYQTYQSDIKVILP